MQTKSAQHILGIDVSHHQKPESMDWAKLRKAGVQFAYIKATEGVTYQDPAYKKHYSGAKAAGILVGFYHFARPYNDPKKEVSNLLTTTRGLDVDLPYVLDIEVTENRKPAEIAFFTKVWLEECHKLTNKLPMIYTGASFARTNLNHEPFSKYPLWVAHYGVQTPMSNNVWDKWSVFQYTSDGVLDGYTGRLDVNAAEPSFIFPKLPAIQRRVSVTVDGEPIRGGYIIDNMTYVPARAIVERLGAKIYYDGNVEVKTDEG